MVDTNLFLAIALSLGAVSLLTAAVAFLLRRTRGERPARRLRLIACLVFTAAVRVLPSRRTVASVAAGLLAFVVSFFVGIVITILIVQAIPSTVPKTTGEFEGIENYASAVVCLMIGAGFSCLWATFVGFTTGI